jgi:hypothetical protein
MGNPGDWPTREQKKDKLRLRQAEAGDQREGDQNAISRQIL